MNRAAQNQNILGDLIIAIITAIAQLLFIALFFPTLYGYLVYALAKQRVLKIWVLCGRKIGETK